jgi:hypothetical protein
MPEARWKNSPRWSYRPKLYDDAEKLRATGMPLPVPSRDRQEAGFPAFFSNIYRRADAPYSTI